MSKLDLIAQALDSRTRTGKSLLAQCAEIVRLRCAVGRLGAAEYYGYQLYDDRRYSWEEKRAFAGYRCERVLEQIVTDSYSKILSLDKLSSYGILRAEGFPVPELVAVYSPHGGRALRVPVLNSPVRLADFLRSRMPYPFYGKPSFGGYGRGNMVVDRIDVEKDLLYLKGGRTQSVTEFAGALQSPAGLGYLFQEVLKPHQEIVDRCGARICTVRLQVLQRTHGPELFRAVWKIAVGDNVADNFQGGKSGNLYSAVNLATGLVEKIGKGLGPGKERNVPHPDTGRELTGFRLPCWRDLSRIVLDASTLFPGFLAQGWDIAICESGPVLLEVNMLGAVDIPQLAWERGVLDDQLLAFLRERDLDCLLKSGPRAWQRQSTNGRWGRRSAHWPY